MIFLPFFAVLAVDLMDTSAFDIPEKYQKETVVELHTANTQKLIDKHCGKAPKGYVKVGCDTGDVIWLGNPCLYPEVKDPDSYAHALCHEIAHSEGWHHVNE